LLHLAFPDFSLFWLHIHLERRERREKRSGGVLPVRRKGKRKEISRCLATAMMYMVKWREWRDAIAAIARRREGK
jgi:hypothetical protein